ncbi:tRNA (cytidine(34)-2'-O)-methyltransferase [Lujinxingia vulgaris]|uniref:Putative tRNA (cytidine(34)-2'-O)-methyltransferase n=1 Tax=Lujinxingia vulgaris TaxID=2600176 RepID=A0A5C6XLI5_9DELT|nr:tRNA (cytidine(34)-2'-O)-methyltransferase [Lujinxingia vulgaris]
MRLCLENPYKFNILEPLEGFGGPGDRRLHIVLHEPEIPGNTGNIGRLCAGTNVWLHLVKPLGFDLDDRYLKRAGLDYWPHVNISLHENFEAVEAIFPRERMHFFTKKTTRAYDQANWQGGSVLIFGKETLGLPAEMRERYEDRCFRIPTTDKVRSLNLSNACAIVLYDAMRQLNWEPLQG